eukprot:112900_1
MYFTFFFFFLFPSTSLLSSWRRVPTVDQLQPSLLQLPFITTDHPSHSNNHQSSIAQDNTHSRHLIMHSENQTLRSHAKQSPRQHQFPSPNHAFGKSDIAIPCKAITKTTPIPVT